MKAPSQIILNKKWGMTLQDLLALLALVGLLTWLIFFRE